MAVRRGLANALESLSQSLLRRRQLQEEKQQRAENLSMQMGPVLAQLGATYSQGGYSPEQAQSVLQAIMSPLEAAGAKLPSFDLQSFAPSPDVVAGPVRESLTPDTTTEQIVAGLNRRPGGQRLTTPAYGETPMEPGGGIPGARQFGPVQNPEVKKLEAEVSTLGKQEEQAAQRGFERGERQKAAAFPAELQRQGSVTRQGEQIGLEFQPFKNKLDVDLKRQLALDPDMRKAAVEDQIRIDTARQQLEREFGPVRSENLRLKEETSFVDPNTGEEVTIPAGTEGVLFYDHSGQIVGFIPGTPSWKPAQPRQLTPIQEEIQRRMMEALGSQGQNMGTRAPATPAPNTGGLSPEEAEALRQELRNRGLLP